MKATIRLFKALPIESKRKKNPSKELLEKTIPRGFVFSPEVVSNYSNYDELIALVEEEIGLTKEQLNNSFHKSWKKVKEAPMEQLVLEQILHYFTTYGFESIGLSGTDSVYIPCEALDIPELDNNQVKLTLINGYTKKELKEKLLTLLGMGIALGEQTIQDVLDVSEFVGISGEEVEKIKNKEVKAALYDELELIPKNPTEFLRLIVYHATKKTLLIKDKKTIDLLKEELNPNGVLILFNKYKEEYGLENLSSIFYRFKPLFLALKSYGDKDLNTIINKIRKLAKKYHKPMKEDYLNTVTERLGTSKNGKLNKEKLIDELSKAHTFRKIRLAYALKFRTKDADSILYRIRNGKGHATDFEFANKKGAKETLEMVLDSIVNDIKQNVKGKKFYIPEYINYTLPATEKQFTGNFPSGTYVSVPKDMIVGVNWGQEVGSRVDLDLSMISIGGKLGWDASYRSENRDVLFSGDMTSAPKPNGATELFYYKTQPRNPSLMMVNYYNFSEGDDCEFKIMVASEEAKNFKMNYMVNPNNILSITKTNINKKQKVLGLVIPQTNGCRFYFAEAYVGNSISSSNSDDANRTRNYLFNFYKDTIELKDILKKAGGKFVDDVSKCDIDLSPETLEKDTILNLLTN